MGDENMNTAEILVEQVEQKVLEKVLRILEKIDNNNGNIKDCINEIEKIKNNK